MRGSRWARAWAVAALLAAAPGARAEEPRRKAPAAPLTDRERLAQGDDALDRVRGAARRVDRLLEDARAQRDVLRVACLSDRQAQAAAIVAAAERSAAALREAVASRREGADVELAALALAARHAGETRDAAAACLGSLPHAADGTKVTPLPGK